MTELTQQATCPLCERAARCERSEEPLLLATLGETFAVLSDNQGCPGWIVLVLKDHAEHVAALPPARQAALWSDVCVAAGAIRAHFGPVRINYECLGNQVHHVHWHVIPRHANDPDPRNAVWGWSPGTLRGAMSDAERLELARALRGRFGSSGR
jgi:diadenosine tetraphosphate (Ap4A) HIT family hydrolase